MFVVIFSGAPRCGERPAWESSGDESPIERPTSARVFVDVAGTAAMDFRIGADPYKQAAGVRAEIARQIKESR
jgi:hypothetical protein